MALKTFLTLATLGLVAAESSVVSLFLFDADPQDLVGSVMAASAGTTTYSINCAADVEPEDCGFLPGMYYTAGPTTNQYNHDICDVLILHDIINRYGRIICSMGGTTTAVCTNVMPTTLSYSQPSETTTLSADEISLMPVTITAGPTASGTATSTTSTGSSTGTGSSASESTETSSSQSASKTSTGGLPQMTANRGLIAGGAVAVLAAVAL
ncbi:hypothetical protein N7462_009784 [Penicillium macrosclerotiorum]|uniref:uncharacterized protein n=1 Tax=Penicillium macrosclerotiorum TaxID=303699 RepID=UPI0025479C89|nr:uncharacterized protein N7462_009784 [Penicillium macrosclerotiorum]KAJ5668714.1 hypothetical protein N7462_009784 [Penicillium macrosclerotiorum]